MMRVVVLASVCGLAACSGIGDGNAPSELEIRVNLSTEDAQVFVCSTVTPQAVLRFTDGTSGDFVNRVEWSSSAPDILDVSDGTAEAPGGVFRKGVLLPKKAGSAIISAEYLGFTDSIEVTVSTAQLELAPARTRTLVGRTANFVDTNVLFGRNLYTAQDASGVGGFSIDGVDPDEYGDDNPPPAAIGTTTGLFEANVAGDYTVRYRIDFCDTEVTSLVQALDEQVQEVRVVDPQTDEPLELIELPLDSSTDVKVLGILESGAEVDLTSVVSFSFVNDAGEAETGVAIANLRGRGAITAFARPEPEEGEDPVTYPRVVNLRVSFDPTPLDATEEEEEDDIFSAPVTLRAVESELVESSLQVVPAEVTMLPGSGLSLQVLGDFEGPGGSFSGVDLTRDVQWTSSATSRATVNNTIGSKGFVFAPNQRVEVVDEVNEVVTNLGTVSITGTRLSGEDEDNLPADTLAISIGRPDAEEGEEPLATATLGTLELSLRDPEASLGQFDSVQVAAIGELLRGDTVLNTQDLSGQVAWDLIQADRYASISNGSGRKGLLTVLTDQTVDIRVRARYLNTAVQDGVVSAELSLRLNPTDAAR
ncbi:MAG: hypothetical protein ACPHCJ_01290 [Oceanococcaceae bacterium]